MSHRRHVDLGSEPVASVCMLPRAQRRDACSHVAAVHGKRDVWRSCQRVEQDAAHAGDAHVAIAMYYTIIVVVSSLHCDHLSLSLSLSLAHSLTLSLCLSLSLSLALSHSYALSRSLHPQTAYTTDISTFTIHHAQLVREDGMLLKADRPATAIDAQFQAMMFGGWPGSGGGGGGGNTDRSLYVVLILETTEY